MGAVGQVGLEACSVTGRQRTIEVAGHEPDGRRTRALDVDSRTAPSCCPHLRLELLTDPCPGPVQQHAPIPLRDAEQLADIARRDAFDVAQHHHLTLPVRQTRQDLADPAGQTVGDEPILDWSAHGTGGVTQAPEPSKRSSTSPSGNEAVRCSRPAVVRARVQENVEQPSLER